MNSRLKKFYRRLLIEPAFHIQHVQGVHTLTPYQKKVCRNIARYNRVSIVACHGVGKTFICGRLVLWFGSTHPNSKIITTAPTGRQVKKLLWSEIRSGYQKSVAPLGGEMLTTEWIMSPEWFAIGYSPQKEAADEGKASNFQGFHAPHMMFVLDEATGIHLPIWEQLEGMTTGGNYKILAIGNPTSKNCEFFQISEGKKASLWKQIRITAFDSPNLIANGIESEDELQEELDLLAGLSFDERLLRMETYENPDPNLVTLRWVVERAIAWGTEHPLFRSKVAAEFPESDENSIIKLSDIESAIERGRDIEENPGQWTPRRRIYGVDPARFGTDKTIITVFEDERWVKTSQLVKRRTTFISGTIIDMVRKDAVANPVSEIIILIDGTGVGSGVVDELHEAVSKRIINAEVVEIQFGASPVDEKDSYSQQEHDKAHFVNLKAKLYHYAARDLASRIVLPSNIDHQVYIDQMPTILYEFDSKGRLVIESKDDYKKRTGRTSPDETDSFVIANWGRHFKSRTHYPNPGVTRI